MASSLDSAVKSLENRLQEIEKELEKFRDLQTERERVIGAIASLQGNTSRLGASSPRKRSGTRRGRGGGPTRAEQFLKIVQEKPGITAAEAAEAMGVQAPSVYQVTKKLIEEGKVTKDGKGFTAVAA